MLMNTYYEEEQPRFYYFLTDIHLHTLIHTVLHSVTDTPVDRAVVPHDRYIVPRGLEIDYLSDIIELSYTEHKQIEA